MSIKHTIIHTGFVPDVITPDNYVLGASALPKVELQPNRDWSPFLPEEERQDSARLETYNCTTFGTLNVIEILMRRLYGNSVDYSDRALGIAAGTEPPGNSPHKVAETIRKAGLVAEMRLPFDPELASPEQYYAPKPLPRALQNEAKRWLEIYDFKHEWVFREETPVGDKLARLREALAFSPVGVSVYAWAQRGDLYVKPQGTRDTHWTLVIGSNPDGTFEVFDSYPPYRKRLAADYNFDLAKRYHLSSHVVDPQYYELHRTSPRRWWGRQLVDVFINLFRI